MSLPSAEVAADFKDALQDLKINSRPEISNLTIIAKENTEHAQAISIELENHIRTTRPEWKLPALYVLDSVIKNVGTPYTVYIGRNLYRTFMDAYLVMNEPMRKAMEGLLRTWKQAVPESMDPRPVFPPEVTGDIENALTKIRAAQAVTSQRPVHALPPRPATTSWRNTPTPPQNQARYGAPPDPRARQPFVNLPSNGHSSLAPHHSQMTHGPQPPEEGAMSSNDLEDLKGEVAGVISSTQQAFAYNPSDTALQVKLQALLQLKRVLETQTLPPGQLEAVRTQIRNLAPALPSVPAPMPSIVAPLSHSVPPVQTPQHLLASAFPSPASAPPVDLAQFLASVNARGAAMATPPPATSTPSLADLLRRVSSPAQSTTQPAIAPFYVSPFPAPSLASTPVQAPTLPAPYQQPPAAGPTNNLAALLASFGKPANALPQHAQPSVPAAPAPVPQPLPAADPAIGTPAWLLKALQAMPQPGTPAMGTPVAASQPTSQQSSAPVNNSDYIELTTASMKIPRPHLISRLYEAKPNQCSDCGRRFEATSEGREKKARHMDWHFRVKDPDATKRVIHRSWYISERDWIDYREVDEASPDQPDHNTSGIAAAPKKQAKDRYVAVPQDAAIAYAPCPICQEKFEPQWLVEANDFVWMDALEVGGKIYHATCWEEYSKGAGIAMPSTPDSVLGKRKAEVGTPASGKKVRAY